MITSGFYHQKRSLIYYYMVYSLLSSLLLGHVSGYQITFLTQKDENGSLVSPFEYHRPKNFYTTSMETPDFDRSSYTVEGDAWPMLVRLVKDLNVEGVDSPFDLDLHIINPSISNIFIFIGKYFYKSGIGDWGHYMLAGKKEGKRDRNIKISFTIGNEGVFEENITVYASTTIDDIWAYIVDQLEDPKIFKKPLFTVAYRDKDSNELKKLPAPDFYEKYYASKDTIEELNAAEIIFSRPKQDYYFYLNHDGSLVTNEQYNAMRRKSFSGSLNMSVELQCIKVAMVQGSIVRPFMKEIAPEIPLHSIDLMKLKNPPNNLQKIKCRVSDRVNHSLHLLLMQRKPVNEQMWCILKREGDPTILNEIEVDLYEHNTFKELYLAVLSVAGYEVEGMALGNVTYEEQHYSEVNVVNKQVGDQSIPGSYGPSSITSVKNGELTFVMPADLLLDDPTPVTGVLPSQDETNEENSFVIKWWHYVVAAIILCTVVVGITGYIIRCFRNKKIALKTASRSSITRKKNYL